MPSPVDADQPRLTDREFNREIIKMIYKPHFRSFCRRLANRMTRDADAEDFVQEVARRAWSARASYKPGSNADAWIHVIARNVAKNALAKQKRDRRNVASAAHDPSFADAHLRPRMPGLPSGVMSDTSAPIEDQLDSKTDWSEVAADLDAMRPEHSAAIVDQYLRGEDWHESSAKRGCALNTVLAWRSRGMAALRLVA